MHTSHIPRHTHRHTHTHKHKWRWFSQSLRFNVWKKRSQEFIVNSKHKHTYTHTHTHTQTGIVSKTLMALFDKKKTLLHLIFPTDILKLQKDRVQRQPSFYFFAIYSCSTYILLFAKLLNTSNPGSKFPLPSRNSGFIMTVIACVITRPRQNPAD